MYDKIADYLNENYGTCNIQAEDVENYLRYGDMIYIDAREAELINHALDKFL